MMGDDMAIRSGGMYGRPESKYTVATPVSNNATPVFDKGVGILKEGLNMYSKSRQYEYVRKQSKLDLEALYKERDYNIANFKQQMADTLASNKMSFYASGLDYKTGTPANVLKTNYSALQNDLEMMKYNYATKERNIRNEMEAANRRHFGDMASSAISIATSLIF